MSNTLYSGRVILKKVRLSFPHLFKMGKFQGEDTGKFSAVFLLDKKRDKAQIDEIEKEIKSLIDKKGIKKLPIDKICLRDGDYVEVEGYEGQMALTASNRNRPETKDRDLTPLTEDDANQKRKLYAGCYVNAVVDFWFQENSWGKRVNCNLYGVMHHQDGDKFGTTIDCTEEFQKLKDEDNGDDDDLNVLL